MQEDVRVCLDFPLPDERIFRYQAMQDILHHLVNNPFEAFSQQELATMTGADVSSISRAVDLLEKSGLITVEDGVPSQIHIDQDHLEGTDPLFAIPQQQFRTPVNEFLEELRDRVDTADAVTAIVGVVLFGSVARGDADRSSDIDLFVVVDGDGTDGRRLGTKIARELEERPFDGDRYQFEVLVETPDSATSRGEHLKEIFDEGIVLLQNDRLREIRDAAYQTADGGT
ncbi:nucleotidyltransferase domain-containing protein [Halomicroarcula sp. GCM10025817]|uniref:nucleotidyltransferase domain-containing protein n=1 Tax=Haloarcula TaxID=2237 RepID=UPI0023E76815|nr:nucleotidyltransferase domain-containing protein [Halomicroarcula sp. SYNS111]